MLFLANQAKLPKRAPFVGKSGRTWFVADSTAGASNTPVRDVFASADGRDHVLTFAVMPGGIRARLFVAPSVLSPIAITDFDVSLMKVAKL
jgi:hypothetical protein